MDLSPGVQGGSERVGGRQRDKSSVYAAESEALDQIAKEVSLMRYYIRPKSLYKFLYMSKY